ncbi:hypothetical protein [Streptomyces sp. NPDC005181]|uniref:hypothetical protein n=1 Tax=Streptomyces sp. NPDC005181 TaxID=3156869 RepID=UPI00339F85BA
MVASSFLSGTALTALVTGTAAAGGNPLPDVGPRGEDAAIPAAQQLRLDRPAELTRNLTPDGCVPG